MNNKSMNYVEYKTLFTLTVTFGNLLQWCFISKYSNTHFGKLFKTIYHITTV